MKASLITLNKLLSDMGKELKTDMSKNTQSDDVFKPSQNSQRGDGDEILLSTDTEVRHSLTEPSQNSQRGDGDAILLSTDTDVRHSLAEISQNSQKGDGDKILLSTDTNTEHSSDEYDQNFHFMDSDEIILSIPTDEKSMGIDPSRFVSAESGDEIFPLNSSNKKEEINESEQKECQRSESKISPFTGSELKISSVELNPNLCVDDNDEIFLSNYNHKAPGGHITRQLGREMNRPRFLAMAEIEIIRQIRKRAYCKRDKDEIFLSSEGYEDETNPSTDSTFNLSTISILRKKRELIQVHDLKDNDEIFLSTTKDKKQNFSASDQQKRDEQKSTKTQD